MELNLKSPLSVSRGSGYENVVNPYSNLTYNQGWLDRTLGDLGLRTKADQRAEDMSVQAAEFEAGLALKQYDDEYNSPAAQAARMRAAGLNPDLLGTGDVAKAAPMGEDPSTPQPAPSSDGADIMNVGKAILSGVSAAIGFAKDITSLEGLDLENLSLGAESFSQLFPPQVMEGGQLRTDLAIDLMNRGSEFSRSLRPRARKRYMNNLQNFVGSMNFVTSAFGKAAAEKGAHSDLFDAIARSGSELNQINLKLAELISDLNATYQEVKVESDTQVAAAEGAEGELRREVAEKTDPDVAAGAVNEANRATRNTKSIEASLAEPVAEKLDDFHDMAKKGSGLASKVLLGLSLASTISPVFGPIFHAAVARSIFKKGGRSFFRK